MKEKTKKNDTSQQPKYEGLIEIFVELVTGLVKILPALVILFIIGVIAFAIVKWAFSVVF